MQSMAPPSTILSNLASLEASQKAWSKLTCKICTSCNRMSKKAWIGACSLTHQMCLWATMDKKLASLFLITIQWCVILMCHVDWRQQEWNLLSKPTFLTTKKEQAFCKVWPCLWEVWSMLISPVTNFNSEKTSAFRVSSKSPAWNQKHRGAHLSIPMF